MYQVFQREYDFFPIHTFGKFTRELNFFLKFNKKKKTFEY